MSRQGFQLSLNISESSLFRNKYTVVFESHASMIEANSFVSSLWNGTGTRLTWSSIRTGRFSRIAFQNEVPLQHRPDSQPYFYTYVMILTRINASIFFCLMDLRIRKYPRTWAREQTRLCLRVFNVLENKSTDRGIDYSCSRTAMEWRNSQFSSSNAFSDLLVFSHCIWSEVPAHSKISWIVCYHYYSALSLLDRSWLFFRRDW